MQIRGKIVLLGFAVMSGIFGLVYFTSIRATIPARILSDPGLRNTEIARVGDRIITRYDLVVLRELEKVRQDRKTTEDAELLLTLLVPAVHEEMLRSLGAAPGAPPEEGPLDDRRARMKQRLAPYRGMYERLVVLPPLLEARLREWHQERVREPEFEIWYGSECVKQACSVKDPRLVEQLRVKYPKNPVVEILSE